ncbi:MAG: PKD domain-containing protein [Paludibacteraceae bacterium]|nr:PKD domain-containing protein [Paludibacteraceae bacterium]
MKYKLLLFICTLILCCDLMAQSDCLNYTNLYGSNVLCQYGYTDNPYAANGVVNGRHTVMNYKGTDSYTGGLLSLIPPGETNSVRLGNSNSGSEAEAITYTIHVNKQDFQILFLKYAVVLENPGHSMVDQPRFTLEILDEQGKLISPTCGFVDYYAGFGSGWNEYGSVTWKDWSINGFDLTDYDGRTIKVRLTTYDCTQSGHFGYAYFTLTCGQKMMSVYSCRDAKQAELVAPDGYDYKWYKTENPSKIISTNRSVNVNVDNTGYTCLCSAMHNSACNFTVSAQAAPKYPESKFAVSSVDFGDCTAFVQLHNLSVVKDKYGAVIGECENFEWNVDGTVYTTKDLEFSTTQGGKHNIVLTSYINEGTCNDVVSQELVIDEIKPFYDTVKAEICSGETYLFRDKIYDTAGTYSDAFKNIYGCDSIYTLVLKVNPVPSILDKELSIGSDQTFKVIPSESSGDFVPDGTQYTWTSKVVYGNIDGTDSQSEPQSSVYAQNPLKNKGKSMGQVLYKVTPATDKCVGSEFNVSVNVYAPIKAKVKITDVTCFQFDDGILSVDSIGGGHPPYSISWTGSDGFSSSDSLLTNLKPGTYILTITDDISNPFVNNYYVDEPELLTISQIAISDVLCYGNMDGKIDVDVFGGVKDYTYQWYKDKVDFSKSKNIANLGKGFYDLIVHDANMCVAQDSFVINEPLPLEIVKDTIVDNLCYGDGKGKIMIHGTGGIEPQTGYSYYWEGKDLKSTEQNLIDLFSGTYSVTITDGNKCEKKSFFQVAQPDSLSIFATMTPVICSGDNNGTIKLDVKGGTSEYKAYWSNAKEGLYQEKLSAGEYEVTVVDTNGCEKQLQYNLSDPEPINIELSVSQDFNCESKGFAVVSSKTTGGVPTYTYNWISGEMDYLDNTKAMMKKSGVAVVEVTDQLGCARNQSISVVVISFTSEVVDCNDKRIKFDPIAFGIQEKYSYKWDFGDGNTSTDRVAVHKYEYPGRYNVTLSVYADDCDYSFNGTIDVEAIPDVKVNPQAIFCPDDTVTVFASGADTYLWSTSEVGEKIDIYKKGKYYVTGTTVGGCFKKIDFEASEYPLYEFKIDKNKTIISQNDPIVELNTEYRDNSYYKWIYGDGVEDNTEYKTSHTYDINRDLSYTIKLEVVNENGCLETDSTIIYVDKFVFPNTFTPNGDGIHDVFMPGWRIEVYNRNGILFYEGDSGWDGTYKGKFVNNDTYFYVLYDNSEKRTKLHQGYITVIR